jgi:hypothetical protein
MATHIQKKGRTAICVTGAWQSKNGILPAKKNTIMMNDEEWKRFEEIAFDD